jgi:hypothetical protein
MRKSLLLIALLALPALSRVASAAPAENGIFVNTDTVNGIFVNTGIPNGIFVNGIFVNGIFVNGRDVSNGQVTAAVFGDETIGGVKPFQAYKPDHYLYYPHVEGTGLAGWTWEWAVGGWVWRTGQWFEGTIMPIGIYDKASGVTETATARITHVYPATSGEMLLHQVEVQAFDAAGNAHWFPMCGVDQNSARIPAIALRGEWSLAEGSSVGGDHISDSPHRVTFACVTGALGKCAATCDSKALCAATGVPTSLGYKRWAAPEWRTVDGVPYWRDYALDHQACTRMIRADYCGDGRAWTATGTKIDVYDRAHINVAEKTLSATWMYEATWNENGAVRIDCDRLYEGPVTCPSTSTAPWAVISSTTSWACSRSDGLDDSRARLGNLRQRTLLLPLPTPTFPRW